MIYVSMTALILFGIFVSYMIMAITLGAAVRLTLLVRRHYRATRVQVRG